MSELIKRARSFSEDAHRGQTRFNKNKTPLMTHLEEVASLVTKSGGTDIEIAVAWLHDVVEDTSVTLVDIIDSFGEEVANIVDGLTDPPEFKGLHTLERKFLQVERLRFKSVSVKRVKLADQMSNVRTIAVDPPVRWNDSKCRDYVNGARLISLECRCISEFLDEQFYTAYRAALKAHRQ